MVMKRKKRNANWQLFFAIVLYAACVYRIFAVNEMPQETVFSFSQNALFFRSFSVILLTINAIILPFVVRRQKLIELKNYYPSVFYLLLSFLFPTVLNPISLFAGLIFILGIFQNLFDLEEHNINRKMFQSGFCVGILSLLHFPLIGLLLFAYLACFTYRRFSFRIFFLPIVGVFFPFLYWYSALYIFGCDLSLQENMRQMGESLLQFQFFNLTETPMILIAVILLSIISLFLIYSLWTASSKSSVLRRKKYYILLALFLFSMTFALLYSQYYVEMFIVVYAIVLSVHLVHANKKQV